MGRLHSPLEWLRWIGRNTRRLLVLVLGFAIVGAGVAMLVLPGPGMLVIMVGLAVLGTEFAWAERALDRTTTRAASATTKVTGTRAGKVALAASALGMVFGGLAVTVFYGKEKGASISIVVAGLIALATLEPRVQRWIEAKANGTSSRGEAASETIESAPATADDH